MEEKEVDLVLHPEWIVTMDRQRRLIHRGALLISGGRVIGVREQRYSGEARQSVELRDKVVLPGLVNGHTHVGMGLLRGVTRSCELQKWLREIIFPAEARLVKRKDFVVGGTLLSLAELLCSGVTAFCDMYYHQEWIAGEVERCGMRALLCPTIVFHSPVESVEVSSFWERLEELVQQYRGHPFIRIGLGPHAIYTVEQNLFTRVLSFADRYGLPLSLHLSETEWERNWVRERFGKGVVEVLEDWGVWDRCVVAAHGIWLSDTEIEVLAKYGGVSVIHNPNSNLKLGSGICPVLSLRRAGIRVGLGTDSNASNNRLDLWREMDLCGKLQSLQSPGALTPQEVVAMATIEGACALGWGEEIGSLEEGKWADLVVLDIGGIHWQPWGDIYEALVYSMQLQDVYGVMVGGEWLRWDRDWVGKARVLEGIERRVAELFSLYSSKG